MKIDFIFFLCSPILLNNILDDMICMINTYSIFTFYDINIEEL